MQEVLLEFETTVQNAQDELWKRFIYKPYNILLDYAELDGTVNIPTPQDCRDGMINAMSWWTPIENGAFFGGLHLAGLADSYVLEKNENTAARAEAIAEGLLLLSEVGDTPGFIARGVSTDGRTHYCIGSDDQTAPWFYGLWKYVRSGVPSADKTAGITGKMLEVCKAIEKNGWKLPCDGITQNRGEFISGGWRSVVTILFILRIMYDLTKDDYWLRHYLVRLHEKPEGRNLTRLQICKGGVTWDMTDNENMGTEHLWVIGAYQAEMKELYLLERDLKIREAYRLGLLANAYVAFPFISNYRWFKKDLSLKYEVDWRQMSHMWCPQQTVEQAVELAMEQFYYWEEKCPRRRAEAIHMREPLFASWIVALSCNHQLIERAERTMANCILAYDWRNMYTSLFFIVTNIYNELKREDGA